MNNRKLIAIDFDGVLHRYTTPWTDAATISDGPTEGAILFLKALVDDERFEVVVVSSRLKEPAGMEAVQNWLSDRIDEVFYLAEARRTFAALTFSVERPPAFLTIDDRGWRFDGEWPDLDAMAAFRPWNKRPTVTPEHLGFEKVDGGWAAPVEPLPVMLTEETEFKDFSFMDSPLIGSPLIRGGRSREPPGCRPQGRTRADGMGRQ